MAKMIPKAIDEETKSSAEKRLFRLFRDMPDTDDWCVLHSVGIARHPTQSQGESDFVVIIPGCGTFVLEVKGGGILLENGTWFSTDRSGIRHMIKNPIAEANNGMHALRDYIEKNSTDKLHMSVFGFGVVFPDSSVHGRFHLPDLDDLQIADADDLRDIKTYLLKLAGFWKSRKAGNVFVPNKIQADALVALLRPNYEFRLSVSSQIQSVEKQVLVLTENQLEVFEGQLDNERCLTRGSAGTGKTLLAVECARIFARQNKRVGFFCYNRQLAAWLKRHLADEELIVCDSILDYMEEMVSAVLPDEIAGLKKKTPAEYYQHALPSFFAEHLIDSQFVPFDCIIIDEAQDVFDPSYLEAIDLMVLGGIENGNWYFFMDSDQQNLYCSRLTYEKVNELLQHYHSFYAKFTLRDNCRNSQAIIEKVDEIFGTQTRCRKMDTRGVDVTIRSYRKDRDQIVILEQVLGALVREGIRLDDIVLLSPMKYERSVASELRSFAISTDMFDRSGKLLFSTVHSFKGLESPVVVLIDISGIDYANQLNLLYVGMTRARSALYILAAEKARIAIDQKSRENKT